MDSSSVTIPENARGRSVGGGREVPPGRIPECNNNDPGAVGSSGGSILLFYQYKEEPEWNDAEHKYMFKCIIELCKKYNICGRGRIAPEGMNCTLSCTSSQNIRDFCTRLRQLDNPLFHETDFKITDNISYDQLFKSLSIRKTKELVAYGLDGIDKAPSLNKFAGIHLNANEYHIAMSKPNTVMIDVRNHYETAIGGFVPPPNGAQLMDPKLRNSIEFPKWLNDPTTQEKLNNKTVLMYCTGGIRCERATALLNQMSTLNPNLNPKAVYELKGGIERYVKTYPMGGYFKGKNYLFDRRMEQIPSGKTIQQVEDEITTSKCCLCRTKWTLYRGKYKCSIKTCNVPVIVCDECNHSIHQNTKKDSTSSQKAAKTNNNKSNNNNHNNNELLLFKLQCELCREGYKVSQRCMPDLVAMKRQAEQQQQQQQTLQQQQQGQEVVNVKGVADDDDDDDNDDQHHDGQKKTENKNNNTNEEKGRSNGREQQQQQQHHYEFDQQSKKRRRRNLDDNNECYHPDRLFVSRLPLTVTKTKLSNLLLLLGGDGGGKEEKSSRSSHNNNNNNNNEDCVQWVHWLTDKKTGAFYGSCIVQMSSSEHAKEVIHQATSSSSSLRIDKKKIKISYYYYHDARQRRRQRNSSMKEGEEQDDWNSIDYCCWPPKDYKEREYPPIGNFF